MGELADQFDAEVESMGEHPAAHIIGSLTLIAKENQEPAVAAAIAQALERRVETAKPKCLLPIYYLLDSLMKNVGAVYRTLLAPRAAALFESAHARMPSAASAKLHRLALLWQDAGHFEPAVLDRMLSASHNTTSDQSGASPSVAAIGAVGAQSATNAHSQQPPVGEVIDKFRAAIRDMGEHPAQHIIKYLTASAANNRCSAGGATARAIVALIEELVACAAPRRVLPLYYVMDSILKNVRENGTYAKLFEGNAARLFCDAHARSTPEERSKLERLRDMWGQQKALPAAVLARMMEEDQFSDCVASDSEGEAAQIDTSVSGGNELETQEANEANSSASEDDSVGEPDIDMNVDTSDSQRSETSSTLTPAIAVDKFRAAISEMGSHPAKHIITYLTKTAAENTDAVVAGAIVGFVEEQVLAASRPGGAAASILPLYYVIDSILKNVRNTYSDLFSRNAAQLFEASHKRADDATRKNLRRVAKTWQQDGVFPSDVMEHVLRVLAAHMDISTSGTSVVDALGDVHASDEYQVESDEDVADAGTQILTESQKQQLVAHPLARQLLKEQFTEMGVQQAEQPSLESVIDTDPAAATMLVQLLGIQDVESETQTDGELALLLEVMQRAGLDSRLVDEVRTSASTSGGIARVSAAIAELRTHGFAGLDVTKRPQAPAGIDASLSAALGASTARRGSNGAMSLNLPNFGPPRMHIVTAFTSTTVVEHCNATDMAVAALFDPQARWAAGHRFWDEESLVSFLEQEQLEKSKAREAASGMLSRQWFATEEDWQQKSMVAMRTGLMKEINRSLVFDTQQQIDEKIAKEQEEQKKKADAKFFVVAQEGQTVHCAVCGEKLVQDWNEKQGEWVYCGAVQHEVNGTQYVLHKSCFDDTTSEGQNMGALAQAVSTSGIGAESDLLGDVISMDTTKAEQARPRKKRARF